MKRGTYDWEDGAPACVSALTDSQGEDPSSYEIL